MTIPQLVCFGGSSIKYFHNNVIVVVVVVASVVAVVFVVIIVVVVVNRRFSLNYAALRNLWYVKFKNVLVLFCQRCIFDTIIKLIFHAMTNAL